MTDLPAGPELDALVAERVMGWKAHCRNTAHWVDAKEANIFGYTWRASVNDWSPSRNWEAMREVVERMISEGWTPNFVLHEERWHEWSVSLFKEGYGEFMAGHESLPHAVCLAALKAMEAK